MAIGSASIAPTAAPSASEHSSESRLRLVRGCTKKAKRRQRVRPLLALPKNGSGRQRERFPRSAHSAVSGSRCSVWAAARAVRLGCPGSVLAYSIAQKPPALHGYRWRVFNGLDGRTARRVEPSHRPAGLTSSVGRNVPKYVADLPARAGSFAAGCRQSFGPDCTARTHAAKRLGNNTLYALLVTSGDQAFQCLADFIARAIKWGHGNPKRSLRKVRQTNPATDGSAWAAGPVLLGCMPRCCVA